MAQADGSLKFDTALDSSGFKGGLSKIAGLAGTAIKGVTTLVAGASAALSAGAIAGVRYNAQMEQYITSFGTMLGGADKAQAMISEIKKFASETPFELPDLAKGAQTLLAFGIAEEKVMPTMKMLGDISQGNKDKFDGLTLAFAQCQSTGKLMGQDLLQMINQGFNPLNEISKMTGKSVAELKEEMSKGAISADMVAEAFEHATQEGGQFYEAMKSQSQTFNGQLSTIKDNALSLLGEITEGFTSGLKDTALPMVNGWMSDLADAFHSGGTSGLVEAAGSVMSEALTAAAEKAPGIIKSATTLIKSFASGISKNKTRIYKAALEIASTLGEGLTKLLPKSLQKPVTDAINAIQKSFASGGLKKAIQSVGKLLKGFGDAAGSLAKVALPVLTKAIDILGNNMDILAPAALTAVAALKGLSIAKTVSSGIAQLTTMITKATEAAGAAKTASSGISALATAAKGAATSSAGLGGVLTTMIGPQGLFVIGAAAAAALGGVLVSVLSKSAQETKEKMSDLSDAMTGLHSGIQNAEGYLGSFATAFSGFNAQQSETEASISEVQANITAILQKGMTDRESITGEDLINLQNYYAELSALHEQQVAIEQAKTDVVMQMMQSEASQRASSLEEYKLKAEESIATMQQQVDSQNALLEEQFIAEAANYKAMSDLHMEGYENYQGWYDARYKQYQQALEDTNEYLSNTTAAYAQGYADQLFQDEDFKSKIDGFHNRVEIENQRHQDRITQIENDALLNAVTRQEAIDGENDRHQHKLRSAWEETTKSLSEEQTEQLGNLIQFAAETEMQGGKLDTETDATIREIVKSWGSLPKKTKDTMRDTLQPMFDELKEKSPDLYKKMSETGGSLLSTLRSVLGIASPSRKMREIMDYAMQGAEQGLEGRRPSLLGKAQSIAASVISTISNAFKVHSPSRVMEGIFGYVMEGAERGLENNADSLLDTAARISDEVRAQLTPDAIHDFVAQAQSAVLSMQSRTSYRMAALGNYQAAAAESPTPQLNATFGGTVVVPVEIEGREVARVTAPFMGEQLAWEGI